MNETAKPRVFGMAPKWARWALAASLAVNFLMIGAAAGVAMKAKDAAAARGSRSGGFVAKEIAKVSADDERAAAIRRILDRRRTIYLTLKAERWDNWTAVANALAGDPPDNPALAAAMEAQTALRAEAMRASNASLVEAMMRMNAASRAALAARIRARVERKRARR